MTHFEEAVIQLLGLGEMSGRDLRGALSSKGIKINSELFYSLMSDMVDKGLVSITEEEAIVNGAKLICIMYSC